MYTPRESHDESDIHSTRGLHDVSLNIALLPRSTAVSMIEEPVSSSEKVSEEALDNGKNHNYKCNLIIALGCIVLLCIFALCVWLFLHFFVHI